MIFSRWFRPKRTGQPPEMVCPCTGKPPGPGCPARRAKALEPDMEILERFLRECTQQGQGRKVRASAIHQTLTVWQRGHELPVWSMKRLGGLLGRRFTRRKSGGRVYYFGVALSRRGQALLGEPGAKSV